MTWHSPSLLRIYFLGSEFQISCQTAPLAGPAAVDMALPQTGLCTALPQTSLCIWRSLRASDQALAQSLRSDLLQNCSPGRPCGLVRSGLPFDTVAPSLLQIYVLGSEFQISCQTAPCPALQTSLCIWRSLRASDQALAQSLRSDLLQNCSPGRPCGLVRSSLPFDTVAPSLLQIYVLGSEFQISCQTAPCPALR